MYKKTNKKRVLSDELAEDLIKYLNEDYSEDLFSDKVQINESSHTENRSDEEGSISSEAAEIKPGSHPAVRTKSVTWERLAKPLYCFA